MSDRIYLRPLGFVWGATAATAAADGAALPIAGGPAACLAFEVIEGAAGRARRRIVPARDLAESGDAQIARLLGAITRARAPVAGVALHPPAIMGAVATDSTARRTSDEDATCAA